MDGQRWLWPALLITLAACSAQISSAGSLPTADDPVETTGSAGSSGVSVTTASANTGSAGSRAWKPADVPKDKAAAAMAGAGGVGGGTAPAARSGGADTKPPAAGS